jgi:hypothetical protein
MEWLIAVVFVVVFLASSLLRRGEEERNARGRMRPGGEPQGSRTVRRPANDIDRFLEEVNRRRRQGDQRRPTLSDREMATGSLTVPASRSRPQTRAPGPSKRQGLTQAVPAPTTRPERIRLAEAAMALEALPVTAVPQIFAAPMLAKPEAAPPIAQHAPEDSPAPALAHVLTLLRSPESLTVGVMLHEILGPPRCRRRGIR